MLSLYKLEIFAAVVQAGSFSAAANRLSMTQPAVSQHIQDLETSLGTSLFNRGRRGVTLTAQGDTLYNYTRQILDLVARAESAVADVANLDNGHITIGATPGVSVYLLPDWVHSFREQYANLNVTLQTDVTTQTAAGVMTHDLDIGFVEGELEQVSIKGLKHLRLRPVKLLVVVSPQHKWHDRESVRMDELNDMPLITRQINSRTRVWLDNLLATHGVTPHIVAEFDNQEAIKQAVMSNMGITILPDYAVGRETGANLLHTLTIEDVPLERQLKLIWDGNSPFTPVTLALLRHLCAIFPQLDAIL